jgi:hypothetical protein
MYNGSTKKGNPMIRYETGYKAYVAGDGNFGVESVITFDYEDLLDKFPKAWEIVDQISDYSRFEFILAVCDEDEVVLAEFAENYDFELSDVLNVSGEV